MQTKYFIIPVSIDYGAEEYLWHTKFKTEEDILKWWMDDINLIRFEKMIKESPNFHIVESIDDGDLFYNLINKYGVSITLIDAMNELSYLILGNRKIFKNGNIVIRTPLNHVNKTRNR